jgi:hypothetical protein
MPQGRAISSVAEEGYGHRLVYEDVLGLSLRVLQATAEAEMARQQLATIRAETRTPIESAR